MNRRNLAGLLLDLSRHGVVRIDIDTPRPKAVTVGVGLDLFVRKTLPPAAVANWKRDIGRPVAELALTVAIEDALSELLCKVSPAPCTPASSKP